MLEAIPKAGYTTCVQTPRDIKNLRTYQEKVLVALHVTRHHRLYQRVHRLSKKQSKQQVKKSHPKSHICKTQSTPVWNSSNGLHCQVTVVKWIWLQTHSHRPRLHHSGHFYPMPQVDNSRRGCKTVPGTWFKHVGLAQTFIHDWDTQFMSSFTTKMCQVLGIKQNTSTVFHPRMDGQSEQTNKKLEQFLQFYTKACQSNWVHFLSLAEFTFNSWPNECTGKSLFKVLMGYNPRAEWTSIPNYSLTWTNTGSMRTGTPSNAQGATGVDQGQQTKTTCVSKRRPSMARWAQHQNVSTNGQTST